MPFAVIYTRVSTDEQAKTGLSLESQEKACSELAERSGFTVLKVFREEGASAKTADRKELIKLLNYCSENKGKIDVLIVWKLDRFARRAEDHLSLKAMLLKLGVKLVSATELIEDTNTGRLMELILAGFAEFDNAVRAERSTSGRNARIDQGGWPNYAPLGYVNIKDSLSRPTLKKDELRAPLITSVFKEFSKATYTQKQIAQYALKIGLKSRKNGELSTQTMANILRNTAYIGQVQNTAGELIRALHEPLISNELFYDVQSILSGKGKAYRMPKDQEWPLRAGFTRCSDCNNPLTGSKPKGRSKSYPKYSCPKCKSSITGKPVSVDRNKLHEDFKELLNNIQPESKHLKLFKRVTLVKWNLEYKDLKIRKEQSATDLSALDDKRERIMDLYIDGKLSEDDKNKQLVKLDADRVAVRLRHSELQVDVDNREMVIDIAIDFMSNVSNYWNNAPLELKRRFQYLVFPDGISYEFGNGFGTAKLGESYGVIEQLTNINTSLVGITWSQWHHLKSYLLSVYELVENPKINTVPSYL